MSKEETKEVKEVKKTPLEELSTLLSVDMSTMEAQSRVKIAAQAMKLITEVTQIGFKAQISPDGPTMSVTDERPQPESKIITP